MRDTADAKLIALEVYIHPAYPALNKWAILVSVNDANGRARRAWLPLRLIEVNSRSQFLAEITLPERLAIEKGLV